MSKHYPKLTEHGSITRTIAPTLSHPHQHFWVYDELGQCRGRIVAQSQQAALAQATSRHPDWTVAPLHPAQF